MLAFESPLLLSIIALVSGSVWLMLWTRTRIWYMLLSVIGWWLLCVYWGMLAISAGPSPILDRGDVALAVRLIGIVAGIVLLVGKSAILWFWWRADKCTRREDDPSPPMTSPHSP